VDNRTGFRPIVQPPPRRAGGHAFHAQQARRALGLESEGVLAELRTPIFHFVLGALVAGVAVLARPQRVGLPLGIAVDVLLAGLATLALLVYDRLTCPAEARPGLAGGALPTAALLAEALVLAGTDARPIWIPAVVVAAVVIAVSPHLSSMALAGRDDAWLRLGRDAAGVAAMGPVLVAGCSSGASGAVRGFILAMGASLTVVDALHTERAARVRGLVIAALVGAVVAVSTIPAVRGGQAAAAATLLVLWYGLRGLAVPAAGARLSRVALVEYGFFVAVAAALLGSASRH
jgi:hypothetical protein